MRLDVKNIRKALGMTQDEFAAALGKKTQTIRQFEAFPSGELRDNIVGLLMERGLEHMACDIADLDKIREDRSETQAIPGLQSRRSETYNPQQGVADEEREWISKLLRVLRSGHQQAIVAVTENLNLFHDYCELADAQTSHPSTSPKRTTPGVQDPRSAATSDRSTPADTRGGKSSGGSRRRKNERSRRAG